MLFTAVAIIRGSGVHCRHHLGAQHFRHHRHLQSLCQHAHQRNACGEIPVDRRAEKRLEMARNRYTTTTLFLYIETMFLNSKLLLSTYLEFDGEDAFQSLNEFYFASALWAAILDNSCCEQAVRMTVNLLLTILVLQ